MSKTRCLAAGLVLTLVLPATASASDLKALEQDFDKAWRKATSPAMYMGDYYRAGTSKLTSPENVMEQFTKVGNLAPLLKDCKAGKYDKLFETEMHSHKVKTWCAWFENPAPIFAMQITANLIYKAGAGGLMYQVKRLEKDGWINVNLLAFLPKAEKRIKELLPKYQPYYDKLGIKSDGGSGSFVGVQARIDRAVEANKGKWPVVAKGKHDKKMAKKIKKKYPKVAKKGLYAGKKLNILKVVFTSSGWGNVSGATRGRHREAMLLGKYPGDKHCVWLKTGYSERLLPNGRYDTKNGWVSARPDVRYTTCK